MNNQLIALIVVAVSTTFGAFGAIFLKRGSKKFSFNIIKQLTNFNLIFGLTLYILPTPIYLWALKNADLSIIFPVTSLTYVWVSLLSMKFLNEKMNKYKWIGISTIIIGVFLVSLSA